MEFQSAPLTEARGDTSSAPDRTDGDCFNPLPSPKQGETRQVPLLLPRPLVSIRSPHRSKGRPLLAAAPGDPPAFQSAPLTEARGDSCRRMVRLVTCQFQSAPLTEARGDCQVYLLSFCAGMFQSAPLTEARGDFILIKDDPVGHRFNPLPSPKQGETQARQSSCRSARVSIRSPHRSKGRPTSLSTMMKLY